MSASIINTNTYSEMSEKHRDDRQKWLNFARRCIKNPFVKAYKLNGCNTCAWCGKPLRSEHAVLHHMDYDNLCHTEDTIKILTPTEKRQSRMSKLPDCESCAKAHPEKFNTCMSKLIPIHNKCNAYIGYLHAAPDNK